MKPMIETMKTRASHISVRTLAMVLCFVMLIGAIGAGTVLTAIAKEFEPSGDAVLAAAALNGADVTVPEADDADETPDAPDVKDSSDAADKNLVDDLIARLRAGKEDLAGTGAAVELSAVGLDSGDGIHLGIGTTSTTWHGMGNDEYEFTLQSAATIYYTFSVSGGNFGKSNQGNPGADSQESYTYYAIKNDNNQFSISLPAGTYKFKLKGIQANNSNCLEYQFWCVSSGGGDEPEPTNVKYYLYGDDLGGWSWTDTDDGWESTLTRMDYDSATGYYYHRHTFSSGGNKYFRGGKRENNSSTHYGITSDTQITIDGQKVTSNAGWDHAFYINTDSIKDVVIYFDPSNTQFWVKTATDPIASNLVISANPTELTAVNQSSTITVTATDIASGVTNLTYTIYDRADNSVVGNPVTVTNGATSATFTVTPNARVKSYFASVKPTDSAQLALYDEVWTASDATITNSADDYIPRYTVTFNSNNDSYGTVTAKDGSGNVLPSPAQVKEGDSVTFTATAKPGNEFTGWSQFETKSSAVTRVIRANTTATGNFGPKGYSIMAGDSTKVAMKELANGTYISTNAYGSGNLFQLYRNATSSRSLSSEATQGIDPNGTKYEVTNWEENSEWGGNRFTTYNNQSGDRYIVYDPSTNEVWLSSEPDDLYGVTVVAKDGTIRYGYQTLDDYTQVFGDTTVELVSPASITGTVDDNDYGGMAVSYNLSANDVRNGVTLKIKTQTKTAYVNQGYYVKGFVVSGYEESFSVLWQEFVSSDRGAAEKASYDDKARIHSGYNEFELTIDGYPEKNIEITPVYAIRETLSGDNIRFYVEGFAGDAYKDWGGTLAIDAYSTEVARKFGEYPGQPMINYNGRYVVDLPRSGITGITLNNYVWDRIHSNLFYGTTGTATDNTFYNTVKANNYQTYDFNDFIYLKLVMDDTNEDEDMIFSFRYRTSDDHNTKENSQLGKSTYYVNSPNESADRDYDYRKGFNTIDINDSIYQWENLTDFYGNRVDIFGDIVDIKDSSGTVTNPKAEYTNPIRIVSNGYDYNKAGNYATAWALYEPVDANGNTAYTGAFDHYQLIDVFGGQGIVNENYSQRYDSSSYLINPDFQENLRWKYDQSYNTAHSGETPISTFVYDLAKVPTVISYEYQVKDGFSNQNLENKSGDGEPAYRSDGRWFTTSSNQFLTAHTIIEYAEKDQEDLYHRDYYQGNGIDYTSASGYVPTVHTGLATGIQAYFDNSDSDNGQDTGTSYTNTSGNTRAFAVSDGDHEFLLKTVADPDGNYTFKGWYMYINGKYSFVSRDENYASEATANDVYVARYYKTPSGNLTVTHSVHPDSTEKDFDCYVQKVEVCNSSNDVVYTYGDDVNNKVSSIRVTPTYMKDGSTNYLKIYLETEYFKYDTFDGFYDKVVSDIQALGEHGVISSVGTVTGDNGNKQVVITTQAIDNFFDSSGNQTVSVLPFYSKVTDVEYTYSIRYQYPAYNSDFGNQAYTVKGTFTDDELDEFMVYNSSSSPKLSLKADTDKRDIFISNHAPYEDNFMQTISYSNSNIKLQSYNENTHLYELRLECSIATDELVYPTFDFAYDVDNSYVPVTTTVNLGNGTSEERVIADPTTKALSGINIFDWVVTSGKTNSDGEGGDPVFIKAPLIIYTNDRADAAPLYFRYWKVETAANYKNMNMASREYTRCYDPEFNLSLFQDCTITPYYDDVSFESRNMPNPPKGNTEYDYSRFDPDIQRNLDSEMGVTISFIENSRNQYNMGDCGDGDTKPSSNRQGAGDRIYSDFLLSFNNVAGSVNLNQLNNQYKCGLIVEAVADLAQDENNEYYTEAESVYKTTYGSTLSNITTGNNKTALENFITRGSSATLNNTAKSEFDCSALDNKNRIQYYYSIANRSHVAQGAQELTMPEGVYTAANHKVFRAYAYIAKYNNGTYSDVKISEVPVYFTIYDMGSIAIGSATN